MKENIDLNNIEGKTKKTKERLKIINEHLNFFNLMYSCKFTELRLIPFFLGISESSFNRIRKDISSNPYGKELLEITPGSRNIKRVYLTNKFYTTINSKDRVDKTKTSKPKYTNAIHRALNFKFRNTDINNDFIKHLMEYTNTMYKYNNWLNLDGECNYEELIKELRIKSIHIDKNIFYADAYYICESYREIDAIKHYDKLLAVLEILSYTNYKNSKELKIKIDFRVISLRSLTIKEYIKQLYRFERQYTSFQYIHDGYAINEKIKWNRRKYGDLYPRYKYVNLGDTGFYVFNIEKQELIKYGDRPHKTKSKRKRKR
ncbi:MAG: hypothetical protein ACRCX2_15580 [Paraclostridium sp.]